MGLVLGLPTISTLKTRDRDRVAGSENLQLPIQSDMKIRHLFFSALVSFIPVLAVGQIDSGGGKTQVGNFTNHSSIGSMVATHPTTIGANTNRTGLIEVLYPSSTGGEEVDSDGNGLPDAWEIENFGRIGVDPQADPDGDGATNLMEYLAGTDPNDPSSVFRPTGGYSDGIYTMPIQTAVGRTYHVWASKNLSDWYLQRTFVGDGSVKVFAFDEQTMPIGPLHSSVQPSSYFFRVELIIP